MVAEYEIDGGTQTASIIVFKDLFMPVTDAEVRVNGYLIDPFLFIYTDFNFISPALSVDDTVTVSVTVDGTEIFNNSVIIPEKVPPSPRNCLGSCPYTRQSRKQKIIRADSFFLHVSLVSVKKIEFGRNTVIYYLF